MKKKLNKYDIVIAVCAVVLITVSTILVCESFSDIKADSAQSDAKQLMEQGMRSASAATEPPAEASFDPDEQTEDIEPKVQEDFLPLLEQNDHFAGWLTAGKYIDFPVVQDDNKYYLTHNFFDEHDINGATFLDEHNSLTPKDDVLIIYGHNMKSGAIFGRLKRYLEFDYLSQYPIVGFRTVYDEEDVYYTPIAAIDVSVFGNDKHYFNVKRINFDTDADFQDYLDEAAERSVWQPKVDVCPEDKLLVLMTCSYIYQYGRLLVICRQLREDESPESVTALYSVPAE